MLGFRTRFVCLPILVMGTFLQGASVYAGMSHSGKLEMTLSLVSSAGKKTLLRSEVGELKIDWNQKKCDLKVLNWFAYCTLDTTHDLLTASGEMAVNAMPQIRFEADAVNGLINLLGTKVKDERIKNITQAQPFDLPFYECNECRTDGSGVTNVYGKKSDSILRAQKLSPPSLKGASLLVEFELYSVEPIEGAFNIIGNNRDGSFKDHSFRRKN